VGDNGASFGIFQANTKRGIGRGQKISDLQDTTFNTKLILSDPGLKKALGSKTAEDFARAFDKYVERSDGKAREQRVQAAKDARNDPNIKALVEGKGNEKTVGAVEKTGQKQLDGLGRSTDRQVDSTTRGLGGVSDSVGKLGGKLDDIPGYVEAIGSNLSNAFGALDGSLDGVASSFGYSVTAFATAVATFAGIDLFGDVSSAVADGVAKAGGSKTPTDANGNALTPGSGAQGRSANRVYAADPATGGTLLDANGNPVYADDAAAVAAAIAYRSSAPTAGSAAAARKANDAYNAPTTSQVTFGDINVTVPPGTDGATFARDMYSEFKSIARSSGDVNADGSLMVGIY
jgi:hypothetical protein